MEHHKYKKRSTMQDTECSLAQDLVRLSCTAASSTDSRKYLALMVIVVHQMVLNALIVGVIQLLGIGLRRRC